MKILRFQLPNHHNSQNLQVRFLKNVTKLTWMVHSLFILSSSQYLYENLFNDVLHPIPFCSVAPRPPRPHVFLPSYNNTPRMTPPGSPPRRHSISVTSMNMFNDRSSGYSGHYSSPFDAASQTGELWQTQELIMLFVKHLMQICFSFFVK